MFARYSNQVADRVERASTYLEEHDLDELMVEAEDFARRQPELFIGGAFTLGLLAARFLKSSASSLDDTRRSNLPERSRPTAVTSYTPSVDYPYAPSTVDDRYRNRPRA
jgi:predicted AlkP superfamily pyrophosphatase or phosphodiesterase